MGYTVNTAGTELITGYKITPLMLGYQHDVWRGYMKFNITSPPFTLGEIDSVILRMRCTLKSGTTVNSRLRSSISSGWGSTLEATSGDFNSTSTNLEDDVSVSGTGSYDFDVDKNNLNLSGYTYFRISWVNDNNQGSVRWASQNHGTSSYRPQLIVTYTLATGKKYTQVYII